MTLLIIPLFVFASSATMSPSEHRSVHGFNKRPLVKMHNRRNMHRLHKVDEAAVAKITQEQTNEKILSMKFTHIGNILKYRIFTKNYTLTINALDGTIIDKEKI